MNTFVGIWVFAVIFSQWVPESTAQVNVTVFYESMCPDSMRFIKKQLYPTYTVLKDYMKVEFVPYGKAYYSTNPWKISCQHGRYECYGNAVQACALAKYSDPIKQVKFVYCVMSENTPPAAGKKCARKLKLSYSTIEECSNSDEGKQLLAEMGERTRNFRERLSFVPTILFNGIYSERDQKDALNNLKSVICRKVEPTPPQCIGKSNPEIDPIFQDDDFEGEDHEE